MTRLGFAALVVLVPAMAAAGPDHFITMDRQDGSSFAGIELSKLFYDSKLTTGGDLSGMRFDLHAQYVTPNAIGLYLTAPIGHVSASGAGMSESYTSLGDIEVGGIFIPQLTASNVKLVLHAGVTLPTQDKDTNKAQTTLFTVFPRITDFYLAVPEGLSVRAGVSPMITSGQLFVRADFGFDANISAASTANDVKSFLRANFGVGANLGVAAVMIESTNVYATGNNNPNASFGSSWFNTGALSARFDGGSVYPYAALVVGLDHDVNQIMNEAITIGIDGRLR